MNLCSCELGLAVFECVIRNVNWHILNFRFRTSYSGFRSCLRGFSLVNFNFGSVGLVASGFETLGLPIQDLQFTF